MKKKYILKLIGVLIGCGLIACGIYLFVVYDAWWIVLPGIICLSAGLCVSLGVLFPKIFLQGGGGPVNYKPRQEKYYEPEDEEEPQLGILGDIFQGLKEGWHKNDKKEDVWEDNSEDNDWLPEDE